MLLNQTDTTWLSKMFLTYAICLDFTVLSCLLIMPLLKYLEGYYKYFILFITHWFNSMSSIFRHWKNRLRCSSKRYISQSRSSIFNDNESKTVHLTLDKLLNENRLLKDRFDKLEERCQQWITNEQIYLLKRIENLEHENHRLHENFYLYQRQSEKCMQSVTDLIIKTLFTQEELRKQCTDLQNVQLRNKSDQVRNISCQFPSNSTNVNHRHTTNDQSTWFHEQLMIVEENDSKRTDEQPLELHIASSQSTIYSPSLTAATKYQTRGLANELYFSSHKPDGDNEKTPPVTMRTKRRSANINSSSITTPTPTRRPISSPVRSTTYVLQQHHRLPNNNNNNSPNTTSKKTFSSSPVQSPPSQQQQTPMTLKKTRQTQQQRVYSNHERLHQQTPSTVNSIATPRTPIALTPRRTSPIVKSTPTKTTPTFISRSPRIPNTPPIRHSRPPAPPPPSSLSTIQSRSPRTPFRSPQFTTTNNKSPRFNSTVSKSPEPLRSVTLSVTRSRPAHTVVNKSKNIPSITHSKIRSPLTNSTTPRVSDLDALMAEKQIDNTQTQISSPPNNEIKSTLIPPVPIVNNIRRSLFSPDTVKVVRPVRSQELKLFSCHLTNEQTSPSIKSIDEISSSVNIDETLSTLTPKSINDQTSSSQTNDKQDDSPSSSSNTSAILRDLSEDSLNSLNEHYHIRQLLKNNISITAPTTNDSSNEDVHGASSAVTSWSRIRSSCDSNLSQIGRVNDEISPSPAFYTGPIRQENLQMTTDGRYFFLIDDNLSSSNESQLNRKQTSILSQSLSSLLKTSLFPSKNDRKHLHHRLVFPSRLGRIIFYRRNYSETDIYQKLCSKDQEIQHNVYHLDTIRDYAMEFYMLTTYGSDSQLRAWFDSNDEYIGNNSNYFDDNRFQSLDDDDDEDQMKISSSSESNLRDDDLNRLQVDEELDWYSELESFNLSSNNQQWRQENMSSCSSDDQVGELLRAEQFSVSSLTTTTSADSSNSADLISSSWPLTNGIHYQVHSNRSSQSLGSPQLSHREDASQTILKEILTYPWSNDLPHTSELDPNENLPTTSVIADEFQPDFYYLCPLKNTTSFAKTDDKSNGISRPYSHDF